MASYSFSPNSVSGNWGGGSWDGLGAAIYGGTKVGFDYLSNLHKLQNQVALDPYMIPALAERAQQELATARFNNFAMTNATNEYMAALHKNATGGGYGEGNAQVIQSGDQSGRGANLNVPPTTKSPLEQMTEAVAMKATKPKYGFDFINPQFDPFQRMMQKNKTYTFGANTGLYNSLGLGGF